MEGKARKHFLTDYLCDPNVQFAVFVNPIPLTLKLLKTFFMRDFG
jgi:hypothetical protein